MAEQSHRAEMSEAIRAQRERASAPRHVAAPTAPPPDAPPAAEQSLPARGLLARLFRRR